MHAGDWMNQVWLDDLPQWDLNPLKGWLAHWDSQMPKLDSITVSIYLHLESTEKAEDRKKLEQALEDFVSLPKLKELKVITMDGASHWEGRELRPNSKKLKAHWTPGDAGKPTLIDSPQPYVETCCRGFPPRSGSDFDDSSSDSDDSNGGPHSSSSHFGDENDDNDNDTVGDDAFENNDESNDVGNDSVS